MKPNIKKRAKFKKLYESGRCTLPEIAKILEISVPSAYKWSAQCGNEDFLNVNKLETKVDLGEFKEYLLQNRQSSLTNVCEEFGISMMTARKYLKELKINKQWSNENEN